MLQAKHHSSNHGYFMHMKNETTFLNIQKGDNVMRQHGLGNYQVLLQKTTQKRITNTKNNTEEC